MRLQPICFLLVLHLVSIASLAQSPLGGAKRVLFIGDSITHGGAFVDIVETTLRLQYPNEKIEIINCGLPSETVSGLSEAGHADGKFPRPDLHERLDRVLAKVKPELVFACYGMNDGIYLPPSDERVAAFQSGMKRLHEKVEAAGARIIHLTPAPFDPQPIAAKVVPVEKATDGKMYAGYDDVLTAYSDWLLAQRKAGWVVIDLHGPMKAELQRRRAKEPTFTFSGDGVHPNAQGHLVMAQALLKGLTPPVTIDTKSFGDPADATSKFALVQKLVRQRSRVLIDAWLTETGHKRPMNKGLPMEQATAKAAELEKQIESAVQQK